MVFLVTIERIPVRDQLPVIIQDIFRLDTGSLLKNVFRLY